MGEWTKPLFALIIFVIKPIKFKFLTLYYIH